MRTYKTFEVAVTKRPAQGWQLGASYSSTWIDVPITCGASAQGSAVGFRRFGTPSVPTNPNQAFNTANKHAGVAGQGVGRVQPAVRDSRVGELRYPERVAAGSASALYGRPTRFARSR